MSSTSVRYARRVAAVVALGCAIGLAPLTASADKTAEPWSSGIVERSEARGGHLVGPVLVDIGGAQVPMIANVGWSDPIAWCTGGPPELNGVIQRFETPSGSTFHEVVHNSDAPVLLFDVSSVASVEEFLEKCASGELAPLATGTVKQRPNINGTPTVFNFMVKSSGVVTDSGGQDWRLQMFVKVTDSADGLRALNEWIKLTPQ